MTGEPCSGIEQEVADRVEAVMPVEGITPGPRTCHDAQTAQHLRVDFVYPDAQPRPLALEVTAIVASQDEAGSRESVRLSEQLTEAAEAEGLGAWMVAVRPDGDYRKIAPEILTVVRAALPDREQMLANKGFIRPGWYTDRDLAKLPRSQWNSFIAEHERLKEMGLQDITPIRSERENFIYVLPISSAVVRGFDEELLERVNAKADVLGQVGDLQPHLQRHLAVFVHRWDVSGDPESMAVPELPDTIDILWVVQRWRHDRDRPEIWVARRWLSSWSVHAP